MEAPGGLGDGRLMGALRQAGAPRQPLHMARSGQLKVCQEGLASRLCLDGKDAGRSGGILSYKSRVMNDNEDGPRSSFMGSDHMPIWCKLNPQWFDHREEAKRNEVKCLFTKRWKWRDITKAESDLRPSPKICGH